MKPRTLYSPDARFAVAKADGKPVTLTGYAVVWDALSADRGGYKVRFLPQSVEVRKPALALYHHDYRLIIGNTANDTLRFSTDSTGVKVEIDLPDTTVGRDVAELVGKGYVGGMSFGVIEYHDTRGAKEGGIEIMEVIRCAVDEFTVTAIPAFVQTSIELKHAIRTAHATELERRRFSSAIFSVKR